MRHQYEIKTRFTFEGTFFITAQDKEEAKKMVEKHCGLVLGGSIHTTLDDDMVDWNFPVHPEKAIYHVRVSNEKEQGYEQTA